MLKRPKTQASNGAADLTLLHLGLLIGLSHLAISLQLGVALAERNAMVRTIVLFIYPVAFATMGLGAVLRSRFTAQLDTTRLLRLGGLSLLVFLALALRTSYATAPVAVVAALHGVTLGGWFLALGGVLTDLLGPTQRVGRSWAMHLAGLLGGYLLADPLVSAAGANAVLLCAALSVLILPARGHLLLGGLLALGVFSPMDRAIEQLRLPYEAALDEERQEELTSATLRTLGDDINAPLWTAWSRYAQFRLVDGRRADSRFIGLYNFHVQWAAGPAETHLIDRDLERRDLYRVLPTQGRVVVVGVGGGRGLQAMPALHEGVLAVERDPAVVALFSEHHPEWNDQVFVNARVVAGDGRQVIASQQGGLDAIVLESARFQPASAVRPLASPLYLYTSEAITLYVDRLAPDGLLIASFTQIKSRKRRWLPGQVIATLERAHVPHTALMTAGDRLYVLASRDASRLDSAVGQLDPTIFSPWGRRPGDDGYRLTDATPFATWHLLKGEGRKKIVGLAGGLLALCAIGAGMASRKRATQQGRRRAVFFFLIGVGYTATEFATFYAYRSFFGDELLTILRLIAIMLAAAALGSAVSHRLPERLLGVGPRMLVTAAALGGWLVSLSFVPFPAGGTWAGSAYAVATLLPVGALMGLFFPLALGDRTNRTVVGWAILCDALGTLAGYSLLYLVYLPLGQGAYQAVAVVAYLCAAWLLPRGKPS